MLYMNRYISVHIYIMYICIFVYACMQDYMGYVDTINDEMVTVIPIEKFKIAGAETIDFPISQLQKWFENGDHVKVYT